MSSLSETVKTHLKTYEQNLQMIRGQLNSYRQQMSQIQGLIRQKESEEAQVYGQVKALNELLTNESDNNKNVIKMEKKASIKEKPEIDVVEIEEVN